MANESLRTKAKTLKIPLWRVAFEIGVSEATLTRWLRVPLSKEKERQIHEAIEVISKEGNII